MPRKKAGSTPNLPLRRFYSAFGLTLGSNISLPRLESAPDPQDCDIQIESGKKQLQSMRADYSRSFHIDIGPRETPPGPIPGHYEGQFCYDLRYWNGVEACLCSSGRKLALDWPSTTPDSEAILLLLGPLMGLTTRLLGRLCLHASVVQMGESAIGLVAPSGGGKSTTAAALAAQGRPVLSDDLLVIDKLSSARPRALPGYPDLRLLPRTAAEILKLKNLDDSVAAGAKQIVPLEQQDFIFCRKALPLAAIYTRLGEPEAGAETIEALPQRDAMLQLLANTFPGSWYPLPAAIRQFEMTALATLAGKVPLFGLRYPRGEQQLPLLCQQLLDHAP